MVTSSGSREDEARGSSHAIDIGRAAVVVAIIAQESVRTFHEEIGKEVAKVEVGIQTDEGRSYGTPERGFGFEPLAHHRVPRCRTPKDETAGGGAGGHAGHGHGDL
jgi:hypothetical protein